MKRAAALLTALASAKDAGPSSRGPSLPLPIADFSWDYQDLLFTPESIRP